MGKDLIRSKAETLYGVLCDVAAATPDAQAIVNGDFEMSYAQLKSCVDRFSEALYQQGVRHGDRVAILSTPRPEVMVVLLAAARLGAIYLGLGTRMMREDLDYVLADAAPRVVFGLAEANGRVYAEDVTGACAAAATPLCRIFHAPGDGLSPGFTCFMEGSDAARSEALLPPAHFANLVQPSDALAIIYTSGSTGPPKGVVISHRAVIVSVGAILSRIGISHLRALAVLPIDHVGFLSSDAVRVFLSGGAAIQLPRYDAALVCETIEKHRATSWVAIPTMLQRLVECADFHTRDLSSMQVLWWAGPMAERTFRALRAKWDCLAVAYGMTEASGGMTFSMPNASDDDLMYSTGVPLDAIEMKIDVPPGASEDEGGEILIRGPQLMSGYWKKPVQTAEAMTADGWFRTGDLGRFKGRNLQVIGRRKELIRTGGYNVSPLEVESMLLKHPEVAYAIVFGIKDDAYGEAVHAAWVPVGSSTLGDATLQAWLRERLSGFKVPKRFSRQEAFPFLANGKLDRQRVTEKLRREESAADVDMPYGSSTVPQAATTKQENSNAPHH